MRLTKAPEHSGRKLYPDYLFKLHCEAHTNTHIHTSLSFNGAIRNQNRQMIKQMLRGMVQKDVAWCQGAAISDNRHGTWRMEVCRSSLIAMYHREKKSNPFMCGFSAHHSLQPCSPSPLPPLHHTRTTRSIVVPLAHVFWIKAPPCISSTLSSRSKSWLDTVHYQWPDLE